VRVLLIEDDPGISSFLVKGLAAEGYQTIAVSSAAAAHHAFAPAEPDYDVVLLDLGLPDGSGEDVLRGVRSRTAVVPVIILTARGRVEDKVRGLDLGANDYVTKPFSFEELLARIRAVLRSSSQPTTNELLVRDLRLDLVSKVAWRAGRRIDLAHREWALLELFMRNPTQVLTRARILDHVWDYSF
jgi:DNA-binding response OmpR family regulator